MLRDYFDRYAMPVLKDETVWQRLAKRAKLTATRTTCAALIPATESAALVADSKAMDAIIVAFVENSSASWAEAEQACELALNVAKYGKIVKAVGAVLTVGFL